MCEDQIAEAMAKMKEYPWRGPEKLPLLGKIDIWRAMIISTDLTNVILEAALNIHTNEPSLGFRYSPKVNEKTRRLIYECISQGYGFPSLKHDEKNIRQCLEYYKYPPDEAAH